MEETEIKLNNKTYVLKDSIVGKNLVTKNKKGLEFCLVRCESAGVFAGWIDRKIKSDQATIYEAIRIWYWEGASSLSQLSIDGTTLPSKCKFPEAVKEIDVKKIIEVIPCTEKAKLSIGSVPVWKQ